MLTDDMKTRRYLTAREPSSLSSIMILNYPGKGVRGERGGLAQVRTTLWGWDFHCQRPWAHGDEQDACFIGFVIKFLNLQEESFFFFHCHLQEKRRGGPFQKKGGSPWESGGGWLLQKTWLETAPPPRDTPSRTVRGTRACRREAKPETGEERRGGLRRRLH